MFVGGNGLKYVRAALAGLATAAGLTLPIAAEAQHERSCHFVVEVTPEGSGLEATLYSFRVYGNAPSRSAANNVRRAIRAAGTACLQTHWANRDTSSRPDACTDATGYNMGEYPFDAMAAQVREDICNANRDTLRLTADIEVFIRGHRGCLERDEERGVVDPAAYVMLAPDYRINCPIRDAGGSEAYFPPAPMPNTRLPGMDILPWIPMPSGEWQDCAERCQDHPECASWTLRGAGTSGPGRPEPQCILKRGVPRTVSDSCCESGLRE